MATLRQSLPRLAYLMPDFHNPAGHLMSARTGRRWPRPPPRPGRAWSSTRPSPSSPSATGARASRPLAAWDPAGQVITIGSMSKAFWAGLRVGWVRADPGLAAQLQAARGPIGPGAARWWSSSPRPGCWSGPTACSRAGARPSPAAATSLLPRSPSTCAAGASVPQRQAVAVARLDAPVSSALAHAAERQRLRLVPGPRFGGGANLEGYLRLPFTLPEAELPDAARRLAAARASLGPAAAPPCGPHTGNLTPWTAEARPRSSPELPGLRPLSVMPARRERPASAPGVGDDGGMRVVVVNEPAGPMS